MTQQQPELPPWWPQFIQNVCEIPDRTSPDDEPEVLLATQDELERCALRAIEAAPAATAPASGEPVTKSGIPLVFGDNPKREPGKVHEEYHAPCGCAFHERPRPHWHPCLLHAGADDNEFRRTLVAAHLRDREKGLTVEFHCVGVGSECGAPLTAANIYRCGDCGQTYCLPCLKRHFAAHATRPTTSAGGDSGEREVAWLECPNCRGYCGPYCVSGEHRCGHCGCSWNQSARARAAHQAPHLYPSDMESIGAPQEESAPQRVQEAGPPLLPTKEVLLRNVARRLADNVDEFGTITDGEFLDDLHRALDALYAKQEAPQKCQSCGWRHSLDECPNCSAAPQSGGTEKQPESSDRGGGSTVAGVIGGDGALRPCPFCGRAVSEDLSDTLHRNGIRWSVLPDGSRHYHTGIPGEPGDGQCWSMHCNQSDGGCGAEVHGDSEAEARAAWNRRA